MSKDLALSYFQAFSRKDVECLQATLASAVSLRDWDIRADGLDAVIAANAKIFNAVGTIVVTPINVFCDGNIVVAELDIGIDDAEPLKVVDILEFDLDGKISAIRAYKG